jgi:hypothetical protein
MHCRIVHCLLFIAFNVTVTSLYAMEEATTDTSTAKESLDTIELIEINPNPSMKTEANHSYTPVQPRNYRWCPQPYEDKDCNDCRRGVTKVAGAASFYSCCWKTGTMIGAWTMNQDPCSCTEIWFPADCSSRLDGCYSAGGIGSSLGCIGGFLVTACAWAPWFKKGKLCNCIENVTENVN